MAIQDTKVKYNPADPTQNLFAYGGNTIDAATGVKTPVSPVIDANTLKPVSPLPYTSPVTPSVPPVDGLQTEYSTPALTPTPQETAATDLTRRIQALNDSLISKSEYKTQQEAAAGIPELQKTQTDLASQLKQLQNEAQAIPQQLQVESTGRGITVGGLAPIQAGRLRTNAIAALGVSSLLDATNGLLASAQAKADRAVAAKYDPIQAQIDSATKNLELILKDPSTTLAEKNRAQAQLDTQKQKQDALDKAKQDTKDVNAIAIEAAKNGADALTLQKIMKAKDQSEALTVAGGYLQKAQQLDTSVVDAGGRKLLVNNQTGEVIRDLGASSTGSEKPPTAAQQTLSGYAVRVEQSLPILKNLEDKIAGMSYLKYTLQSKLPSAFQSSEFQQYEQASKNFINAVLRRESGAAIAKSEFDNANQQYLPQPRDSAETLKQKELNRQLVFENFKQGSGSAYSSVSDLLGGNAQPLEQSDVYVTPDGIEYVKGEDGLYYPKGTW